MKPAKHSSIKDDDHIESVTMKKLSIAFLMLLMVGCSNYVSTDEVTATVKNQMQQDLASNSSYQSYDLSVLDLSLEKQSAEHFKGVSTLKYQNKAYDVDVMVYKLDDGSYYWQIEPEEFAFIDDIELDKYSQQLEKEFTDLVNALEFDDSIELDAGTAHVKAM